MSDSLNTARGRIEVDYSQLAQARAAVQAFATGVNTSLTGINTGVNSAAQGISTLTGALRGVAGAFGVSFGIQGVVQLGKMAVASAEAATAYNRQAVAARSLAGSQAQLNELLETYTEAVGGAVDRSTALANVTKLMAVGFADNADELDKFATVIRGISIAMGMSEDAVTQNLILELFTQRGARLDQLGLQYAEVKARADELKASDTSLTDQMAYQNAVLEQATERFGELAKSPEGAKTGMEKAGSAAANFGNTIGQILGPILNVVGEDFARTLKRWEDGLKATETAAIAAGHAILGILGLDPGMPNTSGTTPWGNRGAPPRAAKPLGDSDELKAAKIDWSRGIIDLNNQTNEDLLQANADYQRQRASSEDNYQKSTLRAAQDFATQRTRQEQDLADSIADIHTDAARRESRMAEDLQRGIGKAQADSAERIADAQKNATERLADLEEDYQRNREKAARHFHNSLIDAAGDLDAAQVAELQRNYEEQQQDAKEAHDEQKADLQKQLQERLDDEAENLAKSITQQNEAHDRQLQDARDADALRIQDMQDDFAKRQEQEDIDYGIRMDRMAEDYQDQLDEMDRAHGERITQIQDHAAEELIQLQDAHKRTIDELEDHHSKYHDEIKRADDAALAEFARLTNPVRVWLRAPTQPLVTPDVPNLNGAYSVPGVPGGGNGTSINRSVGNISFVINAAPGQSPTDIADAVDERIREHLTAWGNP